MDETLCGWRDEPAKVEQVLSELPQPLFSSAGAHLFSSVQTTDPVLLYKPYREVVKSDPPQGPQKIGDCVSWGWSNLVNYVGAMQIYLALKKGELTVEQFGEASQRFELAASEAVYAMSRVDIGGEHGSMSDGSVGAWAAKAVNTIGTLSRSIVGEYSGQRAKEWGARGVPADVLAKAKEMKDATGKDFSPSNHKVGVVSLVTSFDEAIAAIQNGYPVAVCSGQGFSMTRDAQGFCSPSGSWAHCMLFVASRFDRPGLCCSQSWGKNTPSGPVSLDQPDNTFWVDASVATRMLSQKDSFTGSKLDAYNAENFLNWIN